jgi:4-hydroxy-tetrahydrodipicolinate synthase
MIYGTKEATGNLSAIAKTISLCDSDFAVYSGNDDQITAIASLGGLGVISVLSNICPKVAHDIAQYAVDGDFKKSAELQLKYLELCDDMFMDVNPIPAKMAMNMMGMNVGGLRLPLCEMNEANTAKLKAVLKKYELI